MIQLAHKIKLVTNNKAKTHFKKAFGCARLAYNWGLSKWEENYKNGIKTNYLDLKKEFNSIKKEKFPFVYEVSKYATQQPFVYLNLAFQKFFKELKNGKVSYPQFKKKKLNSGSYYIGGDQVRIVRKNKKSYLQVPNLGLVKMTEDLRFNGKINSVTISQNGKDFFASFSIEMTQEEYDRTHKAKRETTEGIGIDLGIKSLVSLSNGLNVQSPKPLNKLSRKIVKVSRQLSKKQHPKTKDDKTNKSKNYNKQSLKLKELHSKVANIRNDYTNKLTSALVRNYNYFGIEDLNVSGMMKNHRLAKSISDVSFFEFQRQLKYKAENYGRQVVQADRFYPSSKTCNVCGHIKTDLKLSQRIYKCEKCQSIIDRDANAARNLLHIAQKQLGIVSPKVTSMDLTALQVDFDLNLLATSKVEVEIQQKS